MCNVVIKNNPKMCNLVLKNNPKMCKLTNIYIAGKEEYDSYKRHRDLICFYILQIGEVVKQFNHFLATYQI